MMNRNPYSRSRGGGSLLAIMGWIIAVGIGVALIWYGFVGSQQGEPSPELTTPSPSTDQALSTPINTAAWPTATPLSSVSPAADTPLPTTPPTVAPALPTLTTPPTVAPTLPTPTNTPVPAMVTAGSYGVNVRSGPGTSFSKLGYMEPGTQAQVIGRYNDWWQIRYNDTTAWVIDTYVTAENVDNVPSVQPPPSPVLPTAPPATPVPTAPPATATPAPSTSVRGLVADGYQVEGAPGPYPVGGDIWFNMWIHNTTGTTVQYLALGTVVEETGQFQKSWSYSEFQPGQHFEWRDHLNIPEAGTYHLWMTICFMDGECVRLMGPVVVTVQ